MAWMPAGWSGKRTWPTPCRLILSVGRLVEKKGFPFLLQAAAILHGRGVPFEAIVVGDGPMRDELERLAGGLGLRDKVVFAGHLTQEQLGHVYRRADVFCLASIVAKDGDRDGLPNVILEAMGYGVPVVASNLSAIPEVVVAEETGLLVAPGSPQELAAQLERMLGDPSLRARLAENARRLVETEFDLRKNTVRLGSLFAQMLICETGRAMPRRGRRSRRRTRRAHVPPPWRPYERLPAARRMAADGRVRTMPHRGSLVLLCSVLWGHFRTGLGGGGEVVRRLRTRGRCSSSSPTRRSWRWARRP